MISVVCMCNRQFFVPDDAAGKIANCKCGRRMKVPMPTPAPSVVVTDDDSDDDGLPITINTARPASTTRQARPSNVAAVWSVVKPLAIGLGIGLAITVLIVVCRAHIVAAMPGLGPIIPQWSALFPPSKVVTESPAARAAKMHAQAEAAAHTTFQVTNLVLQLIAFLLGVIFFLVLPIGLPVQFSRRGCLSMGRWAAMAAVCLLVDLALFVSAWAGRAGMYSHASHVEDTVEILVWGTRFFFMAAIGCFLACAVHPKPPSSP